jgi:transcriptional regulator with XRE-family HTH domain
MATTPLADEDLQERIRQAPGQLIASRIKRARKTTGGDAGLTHDEFGDLCGLVRQHLIKLEKGINRPRAATLRRISEASGRSVDWFLDPAMDPSPFPDELAA